MPLEAGLRLASFEVLAPLGTGGMGEVYRARDAKLGREVALKILPPAFASDAGRLARFEREARLLASLSHPGIAAIHGLEEADGIRFLVLELIAGETLADRVARGPVPMRQALELCRQIAEALESAHEGGVIHRDLKPANVKLTPDGKVKVLDFGLAKALAPESSEVELSQSPTIGSSGTRQGMLLGTAPYMSPEQARAQPLDKRTDIWSFGCLFYETLTGRRPFPGATVSDTIAALLSREPDWDALPPATPVIVRSLLRRCLQKESVRRLHDIGDARLEIEEALAGEVTSAPGATAHGRGRWGRLTGWRLLGLAAAAATLGVLADRLILERAAGRNSAPRLESVSRLTHDPGISEWPTWSPDGSLLAFASNRSGNFEIYVRRVQGGQEINITNDPRDDFQPSFSPDGNQVAFVSTRSSRTGLIKIGAVFGFEFRTFGGDLWLAHALGGQAQRLARDANFPVWHPGGGRVAYVSGSEGHRSILEIDTQGSQPRNVLPAEASSWEITRLQYAPNGQWVSFEAQDEIVRVVPSQGGPVRDLIAGSNHAWDASENRIFFLTRDPGGGTRLTAVAVDKGRGSLAGPPETLGILTGILRDVALSRDGRQVAVSELEGALNLTRIRLAEGGGAAQGHEEELSSGQVIDRYPAFSPDGKRIAYVSDRLGRQEIWILDLETRRTEPLKMPGGDLPTGTPVWSADGRQIATARLMPDGKRALWLAAIDGSHAEAVGPAAAELQMLGKFSPDGKQLLYGLKSGGVMQIFALELATRQSRQLTFTPGDKYLDPAVWSPDGRWIAFASATQGTMQLWKMSAAGGEAQQMTTGDERMRHPIFSSDGRWLYVQPSHRNVFRLPVGGGALQQVTRFPESGLFLEEPTLSPDGRWLAYCRSNGGSSLWLMTLADGGAGSP